MSFAVYPGQLTDRVVPLVDEPLESLIQELNQQDRQANIQTVFRDLELYTLQTLRDRQTECLALNPWFDGLAGCVAGQFARATETKPLEPSTLWQDTQLQTEPLHFTPWLHNTEAPVWQYFHNLNLLPVVLHENQLTPLDLGLIDALLPPQAPTEPPVVDQSHVAQSNT
jgi:hypothetical protein